MVLDTRRPGSKVQVSEWGYWRGIEGVGWDFSLRLVECDGCINYGCYGRSIVMLFRCHSIANYHPLQSKFTKGWVVVVARNDESYTDASRRTPKQSDRQRPEPNRVNASTHRTGDCTRSPIEHMIQRSPRPRLTLSSLTNRRTSRTSHRWSSRGSRPQVGDCDCLFRNNTG